MNPVYFPYTYITESSVLNLLRFFHSFTIYQIYEKKPEVHIEKFITDKKLLTITPASCDADIIESIFNEFIEWKSIHNKTDISFIKTLTDPYPLFDKTSKYKIKTEIQKNPDNKKDDIQNLILTSQVFLNIAEDLDRKNDDVDKKFNSLSKLENNIFENLKGHETDKNKIKIDKIKIDKNHSSISDNKCYMAEERITAWTHLFLNYVKTNRNDLSEAYGPFITDNSFLFNHILKNTKNTSPVAIIQEIPVYNDNSNELIEFKNELSAYIKKLIFSKNPDKEKFNYSFTKNKLTKNRQKTILLKLFVESNTNPKAFFKQFIIHDNKKKEFKKKDENYCNLIFGFIDCI